MVKKKELKYKRFLSDPNFQPFDKAVEEYLIKYIDKNERRLERILKSSKETEMLKEINLAQCGLDSRPDEKVVSYFFNKLEDNRFKKAYLKVKNKNLQKTINTHNVLSNEPFIPMSVKNKLDVIKQSVKCDVEFNEIRFLNMFSYHFCQNSICTFLRY